MSETSGAKREQVAAPTAGPLAPGDGASEAVLLRSWAATAVRCGDAGASKARAKAEGGQASPSRKEFAES